MNMPERISKYNIARVLGKGSMGVVYEGFDPDIQRKVAIKTLTPHIADKKLIEEFHHRFKIEAQASARCMHPNIVTILEYGDVAGMPYMVMEFIDGLPLDNILAMNTPIRFNRAIKLFSQMLKGLHFAHHNGVVHRDIKPSNIMVTQDDGLKITDFGIARLPVSSEVTQMGFTVGTPHYMAPEQEASSDVDGRADLFSLSIILLELLGKVPVTSAVQHACLSPRGIYITPRVNMTQLVPAPFLPLLQKGLAARPQDRFESAQHYGAALKQAVAELEGHTRGKDAPHASVDQGPASGLVVQNQAEHQRQLREMKAMLAHYMGPIGASLVEMHQHTVSSLHELAQVIAEEIPSAADRKKFLMAWESDEAITAIPRVDTARVQTSIKPVRRGAMEPTVIAAPVSAVVPGQGLQLNRKETRQLAELFSEYVGPMAELLLQDCLQNATDFNELVKLLTNSIPNEKEKTDFKMKVNKLAV